MKLKRVVFVKNISIPTRGMKESLSESENGHKADIQYETETGFVRIQLDKQEPILVPRENVSSLIPYPPEAPAPKK